MTYFVQVRGRAERDLERIEDWLEQQEIGLGNRFREVVAERIGYIAENPLHFPEQYRSTRRVLLRPFKYALWYHLRAETVVVVACIHGRRSPRHVKARIRGGA